MKASFILTIIVSQVISIKVNSQVPIRVEVTIDSIQETKESINDYTSMMLDTTNLFIQSSNPELIKAMCDFYDSHRKNNKVLKRGVSRYEFDYKVIVALIYPIRGGIYIAGSNQPYVDIGGFFYEDKEYNFYKLLSKYVNSETINLFLAENGK